eukprot:6180830-Pleurochrysis_carterae.AAC.1
MGEGAGFSRVTSTIRRTPRGNRVRFFRENIDYPRSVLGEWVVVFPRMGCDLSGMGYGFFRNGSCVFIFGKEERAVRVSSPPRLEPFGRAADAAHAHRRHLIGREGARRNA